MDLRLSGRSILVTGATGHLGSATVMALAAEGAIPVIQYRTKTREALTLAEASGGIALQADLRREDNVRDLMAATLRRTGAIDGVVANAGWWPGPAVSLHDLPLDRWRNTLDQNLTITFLTARAYAQHVRSVGQGSIVLVSSIAADFGEDGFSDYAAAKSAIAFGLARTLAREMVEDAPTARANVVAPSWIPPHAESGNIDQRRLHDALATVPLGRPALPADVVNAILWLLSDHVAGYVTGQVLRVSGGMSGRTVLGG